MQISLRECRLHEKKSDDVFNVITAPECSKADHGIEDNYYLLPKVCEPQEVTVKGMVGT